MLIFGGSPLQAQTPDETLTLEVIPAWEGYVRHSWWTEARAILRNEGTDWHGDLVVHDRLNQVTYRQALELPAHSHKQYRLPLFVGNSTMPTISLQDTEGTQQETRVPIRGVDETGRIIALADTREAFVRGQLAESDALIWMPELTSLPETPMAWDVIDVLLLNGISTADLTIAQQEALLAWVAAGGHCIIGGGPALQQTLMHLLEALRIATPGNARQFASIPVEGAMLYDVAAAPLTPSAGAMPLTTADGDIVAVRKTVGEGRVDIVGWDMAHPAGTAWLAQLWADDPLPAVSAMGSDQASSQSLSSGNPSISLLFRIPSTMMPELWPWLLLFPLYIFLVGPGTLLLVRRLKRPVLAWVFIPAWICGAVVILALGLSSAFSQTFPLVHEVAMVFVPDAALPARVVQGTAIYAPRIRRLTWDASGIQRSMLGSYRFDTWYDMGDPFPVEIRMTDAGVTLQTRNPLGVITWGTEGLYDSPDITADLKLTPQENSTLYLTGEVWSEAALHDVALLMGNASYAITLTESIAQGESVIVSRPISATYSIYGYSAAICGSMNYYTPYAIYPTTPSVYRTPPASTCYLTGLMDGVPFPAQGLSGVQHQESCMSYSIPCPTQPPGRLTVALEAETNKIENGWIDTTTNVLYAYAPGATLHYILPVYIQIQEIETLIVGLHPAPEVGASDPLTAIAEISLWNWDEQTWIDYPPSEAEEAQFHIILTGETAHQVFDAQQGVRVRISARDGVTLKLLLTLEGTP
ncbi:MAG: hypothetical protein ACP5J4_16110 [Anaerolineae bacterium]